MGCCAKLYNYMRGNDVMFEYLWKLKLTGLVLVKYNHLSPFYRGDDVG